MASRSRSDRPSASAFGAYIRELRQVAGLRREDVCAHLRSMGFKTTIKDLWSWESGEIRPSSTTKAALIQTLEGSPEQADTLLLADLQVSTTIKAALLEGDRERVQQIQEEHIAYAIRQARDWAQLQQRQKLSKHSQAPAVLAYEAQVLLNMLHERNPHLSDIFLRFGRFLCDEKTAPTFPMSLARE